MTDPTDPTDLRDRAAYAYAITDRIRFCDTDMVGHVNNVAYAAYLETGRVGLFQHLMAKFGPESLNCVLANLTVDYVTEMHFPGEVEVCGRLIRVGRKSLTTGFGVFKAGVCHATATSVNVFFDPVTRASTEPSPELRAHLERLMTP